MQSNAMSAEIVEPYAEALMSLAQSNNVTEEIGDNIRSLVSMLSESKDLKVFLENPLLNAEDKKGVLQRICGTDVNKSLFSFLLLLVDRRRIVFIEEICQKYLELLRKFKNIALAEVITAVSLQESEMENLTTKIKTLTGADSVEIQTKIDPDIIGGVIIKVGSQVFDASLKGQLRRISLSLTSGV